MQNMDVYHTHSLVNEIYNLDKSSIPFRNLISKRKWNNHLSTNEIDQINEVWSKFVYSESFLSESVASSTPRILRWEQFIKLEDEKGNYSLTNEGIWDKIKSAAGKVASAVGKGLKYVSRKVAGKRSLEKGGSLFGLGKKSKAQRAEWAKLEQDQKELIDILKAATSKDYPNNRDVEEFKTQTMKAVGDAEAFIKTHEDPGVRAEMYKAVKKWISYLLDQKIGDHYKHFMENMSLAGAMLILEAEEEKKEEEETLGTKKGSSESIKGLNSKVLPTVLKILGGAGLAVAAGILATHPEIFSSTAKAIVTDDVQTITTEVDKVVGPIEIKERFATKFVPEFIDGLKAKGDIVITGDPGHNSKDFLSFVAKNFGNGDQKAGLTAFFDSVKMDTAGGGNVDYILKRMAGGMDVQEAFKMPGSVGGAMERFGGAAGRPISIGGIVAKQLVNKVVKSTITKMVGAGVLSSAGLATTAAIAGAVGVGGLLSGFAISRLREKSKKDSRAAFLDDLMDKVGEIEQKEEETSLVPPPEPPPEEDDDRDRGEDEGEAGPGPGPEPTPGPTPRPKPEDADEEGGSQTPGPGPSPEPSPGPGGGEPEKEAGKPVKKMTTVNASGSYLSGVANKFLDSMGIKGQDKKFASQPAVAALDALMKKKALLADSRRRLQDVLLETAADIDITAKRVEKDSYKGNPKDHPLFNDVVAAVRGQEKLLPKEMTPEKFAEDFLQYLINNDNVALPDEKQEKAIDLNKVIDAASKLVKDKAAVDEIPGMVEKLKQAGKLNDTLSSAYGKDVSGINLNDFTKGKDWAPRSIKQRDAAVALFKAGAINESTLKIVLNEISKKNNSSLIVEDVRWMKLAGLIK